MNLQVFRGIATGIAQQAGAELMLYYNQPHQEQTKQNAFDITTEGDSASEKLIVQALLEHFPDHHIQGEEGGGQGAPAEDAEYFWYIDPIDGTSNFASDIPFFSVSIALADRSGTPLVGVVFSPVWRELYSAARGQGATLNGELLHVSDIRELKSAMLCSGFPYDKATNPDNNLNRWAAFLPLVRGLRRFGSAALELAWVAAGRLDGYWEGPLNRWDYLAGALLVQEAGGSVTDYQGGNDYLHTGQVVASNGHLHPAMLEIIARSYR
jgi:myo-inositol-1(or 4)-monophosphatase